MKIPRFWIGPDGHSVVADIFYHNQKLCNYFGTLFSVCFIYDVVIYEACILKNASFFAMSKAGRPISSSARQYFNKSAENAKDAYCQIKGDDGAICGILVKHGWTCTSNMKSHLGAHHPKLAKEVRAADMKHLQASKATRQQDTDRSNGGQKTLAQAWRKSYDKNSDDYKRRTEALGLFLGGTNVPVSIVENPLFKHMLTTFDGRYEPFGRYKAKSVIGNLRKRLDQKIMQALMEAKRISFTTDLWTKCDMTPFMGVTAHFYGREDHKRHCVMIAIKVLPHPHTAENIYDKMMDILAYWKVDYKKVLKVITDNASNMIKAFGENGGADINEQTDDESDISGDEESVDNDSDIILDQQDDGGLDTFQPDANLEASFIDDAEEIEFDNMQSGQQGLWLMKHLRCAVHSLQLVVRNFEKNHGFSAMKAAIALVNHFRRSSKSTMRLRELAGGKSLRSYCTTRWSSLYRMIDRLLELQDSVKAVCQERNVDGLLPSQWQSLRQIRQLLQPFAEHTLSLEANQMTTISLVVPALIDLENHLDMVCDYVFQYYSGTLLVTILGYQNGIYKAGAESMKKDLKERFASIFDPTAHNFDPSFIIATALDPRYKCLLYDDQKANAKMELASLLRTTDRVAVGEGLDVQQTDTPSTSKRFKTLTVGRASIIGPPPSTDVEVETYMDDADLQLDEECDPIVFWKSCTKYPAIADLALDWLVVPCSSSASESLFSHAGCLSSGMKSRISAMNLENQLLLKTNYTYLL